MFGVVVLVVAGLIAKQLFERKCNKNKDKITDEPPPESAKKPLADESQISPLKETPEQKTALKAISEDEENRASVLQEE